MKDIVKPMDVWATNIEWDIDMDEVYEIMDEMEPEEVAKLISYDVNGLESLSQEDRDDRIRDYFHHCPGELYDFLGLKEEVRIPAKVVQDVDERHYDYVDWLSDTFGYCVNSFNIQNRERKTLLESIADGTVILTDSWKKEDGTTELYFEAPMELAENKLDRFSISDEDMPNFKKSEIQLTINAALQQATTDNIISCEIGPVVETEEYTEVIDITDLEITEEEEEALLKLAKTTLS